MSKKYPKNKPAKHATIRIPKAMIEAIEQFLKTERAKQMGFLYKVDVVSAAVRELLKEYHFMPRFVHTNTYDDHATIRDNRLGREINIYFRNGGIAYCDYCEKQKCDHITYALTVPEVTEPLEKKGWRRK